METRLVKNAYAAGCMLGLIACSSFASGQEAQRELPPEAVVTRLSSLRHGLSFLSREEESLLTELRGNPGKYAPEVDRALRLPTEDEALSAEEVRLQLGRVLLVAGQLGPDHGGEMLLRFYEQLSERQNHAVKERGLSVGGSGPQEPWLQNLVLLRRTSLKVLAALGDVRSAGPVLDSIESEDIATQVVMLQYLGETARGDEKIKARLATMVDDKDSTLYRDALALRILDLLDRPKGESEANDNEGQGEKEGTLNQQDP